MTLKSLHPCREWEGLSSPRCSQRLGMACNGATTPLCAVWPESRPSPRGLAKVASLSGGKPAATGLPTPCTIGRASPFSMIQAAKPNTLPCAAGGIVMVGPQSPTMTMPPAAQGSVFGFAPWIMLNGDARPMVHGVGKPVAAGLPPDNDATFARPLGDGRDSGQTAQSGVVAPLQAIPSLCEQRGEDNPSHSRQGCKDFNVMLLRLPRLRLLYRNELG